MEFKTNELTGDMLDIAVALARGYTVDGTPADYGYIRWRTPENEVLCYTFKPATDWGGIGQLLNEKFIRYNKDGETFYAWMGGHDYIDPLHESMINGLAPIKWDAFQYGDDLPTAIARCFVQSELGEEVDIPDELVVDQAITTNYSQKARHEN